MTGYKTWAGIVIAIAGTLGLGQVLGDENISGIVNSLAQLIGFILAAYGNWHAHKRLEKKK